MPSDLEARVIRLEQILFGLRRRVQVARDQNGLVAQALATGSVRTSEDAFPSPPTDPTCGVTLPATLTVHWQQFTQASPPISTTGTFSIAWDGAKYAGCGVVPYSGVISYFYNGTAYVSTGVWNTSYGVNTPLFVTLTPPVNPSTQWTIRIDQLLDTSVTSVYAVNHGLGLPGDTGWVDYYLPVAGACGATPNFTYRTLTNPTCSPWRLTIQDPPLTFMPVANFTPPPQWLNPTNQGWQINGSITV